MQQIESLQDFYKNICATADFPQEYVNNGAGGFNVFPRRYCSPTASFHRRDFFKASFISKGTGIIHYADKDIVIDRPCLFFSNPKAAHSWQPTSLQQEGWFCIFTEDFIHSHGHSVTTQDYPFHLLIDNPVVFLNEKTQEDMVYLFGKMMEEISSTYIYKYSKLWTYLQLLIHEALKNHPDVGIQSKQIDAAHRITYRFLELLEKQFPIENSDMLLNLKSVKQYAEQLSVHENHLNHAVKEVTGKSPSQHIALRVMEEAKALLKNTDCSIAEIAYSLRFEYPSHFTSFFKKNTGLSPKQYRDKDI